MRGCTEWRESIIDCALDEATPVPPALQSHLEVCADCSTALREHRAALERIDDVLDRRATAAPPANGPERVLARIAANRNRRWRWGGAAVAAAALAAISLWTRHPMPEGDARALAQWRSPTEALMQPPVSAAWNIRLESPLLRAQPNPAAERPTPAERPTNSEPRP